METILEYDYHLIERFFERELTETELEEFETRLQNDPPFEKRVAQYEFALRTATEIYMPGQKAVKEELGNRWKQRVEQPLNRQKQRRIWKRASSIAAAILILISAGWLLFEMNKPIDVAALLAERMEGMEDFDWMERGNGEPPHLLQDAYINEKFDKVISMTNDIESLGIDEQLMRGRTFIKLEEFEASIPFFKGIINEKDAKTDEAIWNLIYVHYKLGDLKETKTYLKMIIGQPFTVKEKALAKRILKRLD